jgi:hypothetical protein
LEAEHFAEIRLNAKKAPCPSVNKGEQTFGLKLVILPSQRIFTGIQETYASGAKNVAMDMSALCRPNAISSSKGGASSVVVSTTLILTAFTW